MATIAIVAMLVAIGPQAALADDRASVEAGRTIGRGLLILRDPKVCGIALVRDRCIADVDAFLGTATDADFKDIPKIGPHPASGLRAFVTNGDRNGIDSALMYLNSRSSTTAMWTADARGAALYDAGIEDVLLPAAQGNIAMEWLSSGPLIDLVNHAAQIPPGAFPVDPTPLRSGPPLTGSGPARMSSGAMKFAHDLVDALDAATPAPPLVALRFADGPAGDAALGLAGSTVAELIDSPPWLFQADAQRFLDEYAARLTVFAPGRASQVAEFRSAVRSPSGFSHDGALSKYTALTGAVLQNDQRRAKPFVLGAFVAQLVYNAAVLRDRNVGTGLSGYIAGQAVALNDSVAGWSDARIAANTPAGDDWSAQYRLGLRLVDLIAKANHP